MQELDVTPDLIRAYGSNLFKIIMVYGSVVVSYFLTIYTMGENPFIQILNQFNIPFELLIKVLAGFAAFILITVIFQTTSLTTKHLIFKGKNLTYSYGGFFKISKDTDISNVVAVHYHKYGLFDIGDIELEFSGTEEKSIFVPFVNKVEETCDSINQRIKHRHSHSKQESEESDEEADQTESDENKSENNNQEFMRDVK
ncbi:hypothetical protein ACFL0V_00855 [Nanoarchaeota archaeon]